MGNLIFGSVVVLIVLIICVTCLAYNEHGSIVDSWCETRIHISDNKKQIELRRLEVLEKTPELRKLIFHPKTLEKEEK